jgi:hypothetical protein
MRSIKHELLLGVAISAVVFTGALCWGHPFIGAGAGPAVAQAQDQPQQEHAKSVTLTGTIVRDGEQFLLHESSGGVYKLDDSQRAKEFEGKAVKVTGKVDMEAKLIHVESIEATAA